MDATDGEAVAVLCTTSGTTAHPKLAMLSAGRLLRHCAAYLAFDPKGPDDEYVSVLPLPWIMGYDVEPLVTLETKRRILKRAVDERWLVVFEHDPKTPWSRLAHDGKTYGLASA